MRPGKFAGRPVRSSSYEVIKMTGVDVWEQTLSRRKRFKHGQDSYGLAAETAGQCGAFVNDDEDEVVCDDDRSCYNCRYRRWTVDSFECMNP